MNTITVEIDLSHGQPEASYEWPPGNIWRPGDHIEQPFELGNAVILLIQPLFITVLKDDNTTERWPGAELYKYYRRRNEQN